MNTNIRQVGINHLLSRSDCFIKANNQTQNYGLEYNFNQDCFLFEWKKYSLKIFLKAFEFIGKNEVS